MYFQQILLDLFSKLNGERSSMAPYYILRGKKSGQTLQDIHYYQATFYFGIAPDLTKEVYQQEVDQLFTNYWVTNEDEPKLTQRGQRELESFIEPMYSYATNSVLGEFEKRVLLLTQVASNRLAHIPTYYPVILDEIIQRDCKRLIHLLGGVDKTSLQLKTVIGEFLEKTGQQEEVKMIFVYRLTGYESAGLTWTQLGEQLNLRPLDALFKYRSLLAEFATYLLQNESEIAVIVPKSELLTETARKTLEWYTKGHNFHEIASIRRLKESTIEDHFVEIASARPDLSFNEILTEEQVREILCVRKELDTHKLKSLREQLPHYSYFQLRLALAKGEIIS
ncbi:helix-turn-helix domain-containing protein [Chryseomicrobium palamuruense]|uniref:Helix-turn-helix domain-containing protein n=1 Tax=Chryseomicrobium palamuruense TaxID=682973 RepID=A0ABV8UUZ3_9BACL